MRRLISFGGLYVTVHSIAVLCIAVYKILLGTLETETSADVEWQHARYLRTAKKRKFLSAAE